MNIHERRFFLRLIIFSMILGAIAYVLKFYLPSNYFTPVLPFLFPFFFASTMIVYFFLTKSSGKKMNRYINNFMMITFLKLMVYMAVLTAYIFTHKQDAVCFILTFFILYLAYTAFEVVGILKYPSADNKCS